MMMSGLEPGGSAMNTTARFLLERLTRKDITIHEFFVLAEKLPYRELELLSELLRQRRKKNDEDLSGTSCEP